MHLETLNKRCWAKTVLKPKFTFFDFKKKKKREKVDLTRALGSNSF